MRNHVQHIRVSAGEGRYAVTMEAALTAGEGISCFVYGGDLAHVGGQALSAPGPLLHGRQLSRADVWDATVPGHKDIEAARAIARKLAIALGEPVSVSCGIHVDDATKPELALLQSNVDAATELLTECVVRAERNDEPVADDANEDQLILVDLLDRPVGIMGKLRCHQEGRLHRAFSLLLYRWRRCYESPTEKSNTLEVLIQKRALTKYHSGGLWANSVCSHPRAKMESLPKRAFTPGSNSISGSSPISRAWKVEELAAAVPRRLEQELGVPHDVAQSLEYQEVGSFVYRHEFENGLTEFEYDHVFVAPYDGPLDPDPTEASEVKWIDAETLLADLERDPTRYACWFMTVAPMAISWLRSHVAE